MTGTRMENRVEALEKAIEDQAARLAAIEARFDEQDAKAERLAAEHRLHFEQLAQLITHRPPQTTAGILSPNASGAPHNQNVPPSMALALQPTMQLPTFDGTDALSWLSRVDQYFLVHNTPQEQRVQLVKDGKTVRLVGDPGLTRRICTPHEVQNLEATDDCWLLWTMQHSTSDHTYGLPETLSTTAQQEISAINPSTNHPDLGTNNTAPLPLPLPVQLPLLPPVHLNLPPSTTLPTPATVTALLLSARPDLVPAAGHKSTLMVVPFSDSLSAGAPFSNLVMLRFQQIVGHFLWFNALATTRKHEFEPPPDKVIGFNFDLRLEGKAVSRGRQLIRLAA